MIDFYNVINLRHLYGNQSRKWRRYWKFQPNPLCCVRLKTKHCQQSSITWPTTELSLVMQTLTFIRPLPQVIGSSGIGRRHFAANSSPRGFPGRPVFNIPALENECRRAKPPPVTCIIKYHILCEMCFEKGRKKIQAWNCNQIGWTIVKDKRTLD